MEADSKRPKVISAADVGERLPRRSIIRGRKNFVYLFRHGTRIEGSLLSCFVSILPDSSGIINNFCFAVSVKRRAGSAVLRNKIRRWVRESYRRNKKVLAVLSERTDKSIAVLFSYRRNIIEKKIRYMDIECDVKFILENIVQIKDWR